MTRLSFSNSSVNKGAHRQHNRVLKILYQLSVRVKTGGVEVMEINVPIVIGTAPSDSTQRQPSHNRLLPIAPGEQGGGGCREVLLLTPNPMNPEAVSIGGSSGASQQSVKNVLYLQCRKERATSIALPNEVYLCAKGHLSHTNKYPFYVDLPTSSKQSRKVSMLANAIGPSRGECSYANSSSSSKFHHYNQHPNQRTGNVQPTYEVTREGTSTTESSEEFRDVPLSHVTRTGVGREEGRASSVDKSMQYVQVHASPSPAKQAWLESGGENRPHPPVHNHPREESLIPRGGGGQPPPRKESGRTLPSVEVFINNQHGRGGHQSRLRKESESSSQGSGRGGGKESTNNNYSSSLTTHHHDAKGRSRSWRDDFR